MSGPSVVGSGPCPGDRRRSAADRFGGAVMASLLNEIVGFISRAEEIAYYRQASARERDRAAKAGPESGHTYQAHPVCGAGVGGRAQGVESLMAGFLETFTRFVDEIGGDPFKGAADRVRADESRTEDERAAVSADIERIRLVLGLRGGGRSMKSWLERVTDLIDHASTDPGERRRRAEWHHEKRWASVP